MAELRSLESEILSKVAEADAGRRLAVELNRELKAVQSELATARRDAVTVAMACEVKRKDFEDHKLTAVVSFLGHGSRLFLVADSDAFRE